MKKLLLLALLALWPAHAKAQGVVACNSSLTQTAVLSSFADNVPGGITPKNLRDYICSLSNGSSSLSKLSITPPTGQNVGISLAQTATGGSNTAQPFNLNTSTINDQMTQAGVGYQLNYFLNGNWQNEKTAFDVFAAVGNNPAGAGVANDNVTGIAASSAGLGPVTGPFSVAVFSLNPYAWIAAGATSYFAVVGEEVDVGISSTGSAQERIGVQVIASPPQNGVAGDNGQQASGVVDAAYIAGTSGSSAPWKNGWYWYANTFNSSSNILTGAATPANYGVDFNNVTFNTAAFRSPGFLVDKSGNVAVGTTTPVIVEPLVIHAGAGVNALFSSGSGGLFWNNLNDTNSAWVPAIINGQTITLETGTTSAFTIDSAQNVIVNHVVGAGSAPTCSSTGIGASGTCVLATGSSDLTGVMQLTPSGAGITTTGSVTLTLHASLGSHGANCIYNQGSVTGVWSQGSTFQITGTSSTAPTVFWNNNGSNLTSGSVYTFNYQCMGF